MVFRLCRRLRLCHGSSRRVRILQPWLAPKRHHELQALKLAARQAAAASPSFEADKGGSGGGGGDAKHKVISEGSKLGFSVGSSIGFGPGLCGGSIRRRAHCSLPRIELRAHAVHKRAGVHLPVEERVPARPVPFVRPPFAVVHVASVDRVAAACFGYRAISFICPDAFALMLVILVTSHV